MTQVTAQYFLSRQGERLRLALAGTPDFKWIDAHRGLLQLGPFTACVALEPDDWIAVSLKLDSAPAPKEALEATHRLPGSLRFAISSTGAFLAAETRFDGALHLPTSMEEIRAGLSHAAGGPCRPSSDSTSTDPKTIPAAEVESALAGLGWGDGDIVTRDDGWELRPRLAGVAVPVCITIDGGHLRLHHPVLRAVPGGEAAEAVADQALRLNRSLRLARLAIDGEGVCAETRLHRGLIDPDWLRVAARAVAAAAVHGQPGLKILAQEPAVARCYAEMLLFKLTTH
jgi:hypothetical protein